MANSKSGDSISRQTDNCHEKTRSALGISLGLMLGLLPKGSLLVVAVLLVAMFCTARIKAFMAAAIIATLFSKALDPFTNQLGALLLTWRPLEGFWGLVNEIPMVPWLRLENTVVVGSLVLGLVLFLPVFVVTQWALARNEAPAEFRTTPRSSRNLNRGILAIWEIAILNRRRLIFQICLVFAFAFAVWIFRNTIAERSFVNTAESIIGTNVELGDFQFSASRGRLGASDIQIVDPNIPLKNIVQVERAEIEFDSRQLYSKRWVLPLVHLHNVQFGTPRLASGIHSRVDNSTDETDLFSNGFSDPGLGETLTSPAATMLATWQFEYLNSIQAIDDCELECSDLMKKLEVFWDSQLKHERQALAILNSRANRIKADLDKSAANPLRNLNLAASARHEAKQIQQQLKQREAMLFRLRMQIERDIVAISSTVDSDLGKIEKTGNTIHVSTPEVTQLLFLKFQQELISHTNRLVKEYKKSIAFTKKGSLESTDRGFNVPFRKVPQLLIERLIFNGERDLLGQQTLLRGEFKNVTTEGGLAKEPMRFELFGEPLIYDNNQWRLSGVVDRSGFVETHALQFELVHADILPKMLGIENVLLLACEPGDVECECNLSLKQNYVTGFIQFSSDQPGLELNEWFINDNTVDKRLGGKLRGIQDFDLFVELSGPLDKPKSRIQSDLGDRVANVIESTLNALVLEHRNAKRDTYEMQFNQSLSKLRKQVLNSIDELASRFEEQVTAVAGLQTRIDLNDATRMR